MQTTWHKAELVLWGNRYTLYALTNAQNVNMFHESHAVLQGDYTDLYTFM